MAKCGGIAKGTDSILWRRFALWGTVLVFIATHWPRLEIRNLWVGSDKLLHAGVFGALYYLWHRARWIQHGYALWLIALAYSALDEWSQSLPFINRHTSVADYIADAAGITITAGVLMARSRLHRGIPGQWRLLLRHAAMRAVLRSPQGWAVILASAALGVLVFVPILVVLLLGFPTKHVHDGILGGVLGAIAGAQFAIHRGVRHHSRRICASRPCLHCEASTESVVLDESGIGTCGSCQARIHRGAWVEPFNGSLPITRQDLRSGYMSLIVAPCIGLFACAVFVMFVSLAWLRSPLQEEPGLALVLGAGGMILIVTAAMQPSIALGQRGKDQEGEACLRCGHDLRSTPCSGGVGTCPECGGAFPRFGSCAPEKYQG